MALKPYKLIIAGGRDFDDYGLLEDTLYAINKGILSEYSITLLSGMARGADALGYMFAHKNNIQCEEYHADWQKYGKRAGFIRNEIMGKAADGLVAFWDGKSQGTAHMIRFMEQLNKDYYIVQYQRS